jgi:hypothetical protein
MRNAYKVLVGKPERIDHLRHLVVGGRMVLKMIVNKVQGCEMDTFDSG